MIPLSDKVTGRQDNADVFYSSYDICLVQDCNLRCKYCSTGFGRWGEKPGIMSRKTIDSVVSFIKKTSRDRFNISFSGGETLFSFNNLRCFMDRIFDARRELGKKVLVEVATNGINLTEDMADYLAANKVTLSFSLDGDRVSTNRNRIMSDGSGVYDRVRNALDLYKKALEKNGLGNTRIKAECTIDEKANIFESVHHLFEIGFNDVLARPATGSSFTGFHGGDSFSKYLSSFREIVDYVLAPLEKEDIIIGNYDRMFLNIKAPLLGIISGEKELSTCGIITNKICVTASGKITPCFLANGFSSDLMVIGDVGSGIDKGKSSRLLKDMNDRISDCTSCWCRSVCKACYLKLIEKGIGRSEYCRLQRESMAILVEEASKRYGLHPALKND
jgi:radical SAM protein with 4Fe4S-binding SPASM domain